MIIIENYQIIIHIFNIPGPIVIALVTYYWSEHPDEINNTDKEKKYRPS